MKTYDLALTDWIMATTTRLSVVFFLKTLLLESLNISPSIALTVEKLKTTLCVVDRYGLLVFFLFRAMYTLDVYRSGVILDLLYHLDVIN